MLAFIRKTTYSTVFISLTLFLLGCNGSDTANQRPKNSNPFAPADSNFAPPSQRSSTVSRTRRPNNSQTRKNKAKPKKKLVTDKPPRQSKLITEAENLEQSLDSDNTFAAQEKETAKPVTRPAPVTLPAKESQPANTSKPMVKTKEAKTNIPEIKGHDRDLKPRAGEETIDWALRVISGSSATAHDTACKKLASMEPDQNHIQRVSAVLASTLPLAKDGFRMKEHVNAMAVWYSDDATIAFSTLLADEKSALVREKIIALLPKIHSETTAQVIVNRLSNRADRKHARTALRIMGQIAEKPVIKLLNNPDSSLRIEACKILQYIGGTDALDALKVQSEIEESSVIKDLISQTQAEIKKKLANPDE